MDGSMSSPYHRGGRGAANREISGFWAPRPRAPVCYAAGGMTRYELVERIGFGGMAEVFRGVAVAAGGFEKPVAIKRILPHLGEDERFVELLMAEAKFLSHLRHRNIVQIYDVGLGDDDQYFLVMEYVDGVNLGKLYDALEARGKRLPLEVALHIGAEVCEALDHAHRVRGSDGKPLGLVHRDISPSNVLLSRSGEVKLTDFGIAKRMEEHTGHGGVRGKFAYISPEQASSKPVDGRSDVFSLGVVLYELVLGHRLFSQLPDFKALQAVLDGRVKPPREIDASLPSDLEEILMSALAHDPEQRFASASAFGTELRGYRYRALSTAGDPASELSSILGRYDADADAGAAPREHTVVRLQSAADFAGAQGPGRGELEKARAVIDAFEEETRAVQMDPMALMAQGDSGEMAAADPGEDDAETRIMTLSPADADGAGDEVDERGGGGAAHGQPERADSRSATVQVGAPAVAGEDAAWAKPPIAPGGEPLISAQDGRGDVSGAPVLESAPRAARGGGSRGAWLGLVIAAVAVGVSAFFIASAFFEVQAPGANTEGSAPGAGEVASEAEEGGDHDRPASAPEQGAEDDATESANESEGEDGADEARAP